MNQGANYEKNESNSLENDNNQSANGVFKGLDILKKVNDLESQQIFMPAGAKVLAFAGTADKYLRCIFAYYKI